ncbi:hypothetical protein DH2020_032321 [Rehmannia glutinosa]|uniref:Uncharacterized protein n=1 Tax=Rehmannia glutinosa TaxID=99300 RepID=A0ABR0VFH7_REHGL
MDFFSSLAKGGQPKPTSDQPNNQGEHTNSDLFASAKVVADAAQAQFRNEPEKYDKAKVAGASADILDAAKEYGKLDETTGVGKYVDQAENYLRQYNTPAPASGDKNTTTPDVTASEPAAGDSDDVKTAPTATAITETTDGEKPSGGGADDYVKEAEDFLDKPSDAPTGATINTETTDDEKPAGAGSGAGDYVKEAEDFLDKPSDAPTAAAITETSEGEKQAGGGAGDYVKEAENFFNKPSDGTAEGGDAEDNYVKKAEGFLNKPSGDGGEKTDEPSSKSESGYGDNVMKMAGGFFNK